MLSDVLAWRSRVVLADRSVGRGARGRERRRRRACRPPRVASARPCARAPLADRDAEEPARGDRALARSDRRRRARGRRLRGRQRPHQPLHRPRRGGRQAWTWTRCSTSSTRPRRSAPTKRPHRAIVNFLWSSPGYLCRRAHRVGHRIRPGGTLPPPPSIAAYLRDLDRLDAPRSRRALGRGRRHPRQHRRTGPRRDERARLAARRRGTRAATRRHGAGGRIARRHTRPLAMASGEPQRILPMAGVVLPWLLVSGRRAELRAVTEELLDALRRPLARGHVGRCRGADALRREGIRAAGRHADSLGHVGRAAAKRPPWHLAAWRRTGSRALAERPAGRGRAPPGGCHGAPRRARARLRRRLSEAGARGRAGTRGRHGRGCRDCDARRRRSSAPSRCVNPF